MTRGWIRIVKGYDEALGCRCCKVYIRKPKSDEEAVITVTEDGTVAALPQKVKVVAGGASDLKSRRVRFDRERECLILSLFSSPSSLDLEDPSLGRKNQG